MTADHPAENREGAADPLEAPRAYAWERDWLSWFLVFTAIVSLLGLVDVLKDVGRPFGGFAAFNRALVPVLEVDANTPQWWPALANEDLSYSEWILELNGHVAYPDGRKAFDEAAAAGESSVRAVIRDGDEIVTREVPVVAFKLAHVVDFRLPDLITALSYWLLALIVYRAEPDWRQGRAFVILGALVALVRALFVHSVHYDGHWLTNTMEILLQVALPFLGVAVVYFTGVFPWPAGRAYRAGERVMLAFAVVVALMGAASRIQAIPPERRIAFEYYGHLLLLSLFAIGVFTGLVTLLIRFFQSRRGTRERRMVGAILIGLAFTLPMVLASLLSALPDSSPLYYWRGIDLRYLLVAMPLAYAYSVLRYQAERSPPAVYFYVMILNGSALLASIGVTFWTQTQPNWPESGTRPPFAALFAVALISGLLWRWSTLPGGPFDRLLHRERSGYTATLRFGRDVTGQNDLLRLPDTMATALVRELSLESAAVWVGQADSPTLQLAARRARATFPAPRLPDELSPPLDVSSDAGRPYRLHRPASLPAWLRPLASDGAIAVAVPLLDEGRVIGLLALGRRWDEEVFDERDLEVYELIGHQASRFLVAAVQVAELRRVPERLVEAQEQERLLLSAELHDTVQQFLGRLPFYLTIVRDSLPQDIGHARLVLNQIVDDSIQSAKELRDIRHNLAPSQLEQGLVGPLMSLVAYYERYSHVDMALDLTPDLDGATSLASRLAIYRVIQQALDNVQLHAEAGRVEVRVRRDAGRIDFTVADDGRGFDEARQIEAYTSGSFGLQSMRARMHAIGGEFAYRSAPGRGTVISGWAPESRADGMSPVDTTGVKAA